MSIEYPQKVNGGAFYLGEGLQMTTMTVTDSEDENISKTFNVLDVTGSGGQSELDELFDKYTITLIASTEESVASEGTYAALYNSNENCYMIKEEDEIKYFSNTWEVGVGWYNDGEPYIKQTTFNVYYVKNTTPWEASPTMEQGTTPVITGDATYNEDSGNIVVTGNCTISLAMVDR